MRHIAWLNPTRLHVPQLLNPNAIDLRIQIVELVFLHKLLGEGSARSFSQYGHFGAEFVSRRVIVLGLAVLIEPLVFRDYARDSVTLINELRTAELREQVHAGFFYKPT